MIIAPLTYVAAFQPLEVGVGVWSICLTMLTGFVFLNPAGVISYTHETKTEITKPIQSRTITNVIVQSGHFNDGPIISTSWRIPKAIAT
jgi:hypothetical protein